VKDAGKDSPRRGKNRAFGEKTKKWGGQEARFREILRLREEGDMNITRTGHKKEALSECLPTHPHQTLP